ncbi:MAG: phosphatase PAP2 family protein [Nanoarchaeota archaeon]
MKKTGISLLVFFAVLLIASFYFDSEIINLVSMTRNGALDNFFLGLSFLSSEIIIFFFLTSLFLWQEHKRKWIMPLWLTLGMTTIASFLIKLSMQRARPYQQGLVQILPVLAEESHNIWNFSFPSFQAALVFCAIPILSKEFPRFKYVWIFFAAIISFSRIYFGVHFLSDVIAGGLIGYLIGLFILKFEKENKFWERVYEKVFRKE